MAGDVCRGCGAEVKRAITLGAKILDLEPRPRPDGNVIIVVHESRVRAKVLCGDEMPAQQEAFKAHQCPKPKPLGLPCPVCALPMDRELAISQGWWCHPCCDQSYLRELAEQGLATPQIERMRRRAG